MAYTPLVRAEDVARLLVPGQARENHHLDFKGLDAKGAPYDRNDAGRRESAGDVAQFANASGGILVIGAVEQNHVLQGFTGVPAPDELIRWLDDVVKGHLEPVPPVDPRVLNAPNGERIVVVNVPPSAVLIGRKYGTGYDFPIRAGDSKRYMTLIEVEARMVNRERLMKLRLEQIPRDVAVSLDARTGGIDARDWHVDQVGDHTVTLSKGALRVEVPLSYIEAVYRTQEPGALWVIAMDCHIQQVEHRLRVRKFVP